MTDWSNRSVVTLTSMMLTCLVLGLLAGGMLVIGISFVSFWRSLAASDFQAWFASYSHLIGRLMIPLGAAVSPSPWRRSSRAGPAPRHVVAGCSSRLSRRSV
jgi:hypothetical protein